MKDMAGMEASKLIIALIMAVVFIVVAMVLLPTIYNEVSVATSNTTLDSNKYIAPSLGLVSLVPILFIVGIVVAVIVLMLRGTD
jgi:hypothetical protein